MASTLAWGCCGDGDECTAAATLTDFGDGMDGDYVGGVYLGVFAEARLRLPVISGVIPDRRTCADPYSGVLTPIIAMILSTFSRLSLVLAAGGGVDGAGGAAHRHSARARA
jgi:hypothetical protein